MDKAKMHNLREVLLIPTFLLLNLVAYSQTGPGGIGTNDGLSTLSYWIEGDSGVTINGSNEITAILDLSGYGRTNTINGTPTIEADLLNNHDVLRFNGTDESIQTNWDIEETTYPSLTAIAVYTPDVDFSQTVWGAHATGFEGRYLTDNNVSAPTTTNFVGPGYNPNPLPHGASQITGLFPTGVTVLTSVVMVEDVVDGTDVRVNGAVASSFTSDHSGDALDDLAIANGSGSNFWFDGDIAEVIFYGEALSDLQLIIVENYLAAKYGLALTANDLYLGDNSGYDFDVIGIGRINSGDIHNQSQGAGILTLSNPSDLGDNEYLFVGHDDAALAFGETTDVPTGVESRFTRVWSNTETGEVGAVDLQWDLDGLGTFNANQLALLVDTDNDGLFNDESPITSPTDLGTNVFEFETVNSINNGLIFTLAQLETPLPVELISLNVSQQKSEIQIRWATGSEINNDFFAIERSKNGSSWETIGTVSGSGTSSDLKTYYYIDKSPISGGSYYRLKQVDFDGSFEYSPIQFVQFQYDQLHKIILTPNPSSTHLKIVGADQTDVISMHDLMGRSVDSLIDISWENGYPVLNWTFLSPGTYILKIKNETTTSSHEVVIR